MAQWSFIRHGQSQANAERWFAGVFDAPLTARGREQAIAARDQLAGVSFERAFSSDLSRAFETAKLVLEGRSIALVTTPHLRERSCGSWQCHAIDEIESRGDMDVFLAWDGRPPKGESLRDVAIRALSWLVDVDDGTDTLIVAHGALLRAVLGLVDAVPTDEIGRWRPRNCEVMQRDLEPGTWARLLDLARTSGS